MKHLIKNKKAYFEFSILEKYTAGIKLHGSEVKSIRNGKVSITEAYCFIANNEVFIKGMHISEHKEGGKHNNHQPIRDRKLLLTKKEIIKFLLMKVQKEKNGLKSKQKYSHHKFIKMINLIYLKITMSLKITNFQYHLV